MIEKYKKRARPLNGQNSPVKIKTAVRKDQCRSLISERANLAKILTGWDINKTSYIVAISLFLVNYILYYFG